MKLKIWTLSNLKAPRCFKHGSFFCSEGSSAVLLWTTNPNPLFFYALALVIQTTPAFVPFFEQKIQGRFKDFHGHISHFSRTLFSAKESLESIFFVSSTTWVILSQRSFCVCSFSLEFYLIFQVSIEIQGLSITDCNFQGLSRPWIIILKFRTFKVRADPELARKNTGKKVTKERLVSVDSDSICMRTLYLSSSLCRA